MSKSQRREALTTGSAVLLDVRYVGYEWFAFPNLILSDPDALRRLLFLLESSFFGLDDFKDLVISDDVFVLQSCLVSTHGRPFRKRAPL
jgi:hypothetical protein